MRLLIRSAVALCLIVVSACTCSENAVVDAGVIDAGPPVAAEAEPNNGPEAAQVIDRTGSVEANLGADPAKPDEDWFVLKAALPKTVALEVSCPPGADVSIEVVDDARTVLAAVNAGGIGASESLPNIDVSGKTWVRVVGVKKGAGGAYTLKATFLERVPGFEVEPNDRRVDATQVALGQAISGYLAHPNDSDWFRFELPLNAPLPEQPIGEVQGDDAGAADSGTVDAVVDAGMAVADAGAADAGAPKEKRIAMRIDVSAVPGVTLEVQLLTAAEAVLFSAKSLPGAGLSLRNVAARETDRELYVVVRGAPTSSAKDAKRGFNATQSYTLTFGPEDAAENAELEPNDDAAHATDLPANGLREGFISPQGDVDYFRLIPDSPSIVKLQVTGVEKVDLVLSVIKPSEGKADEVLLRANEGTAKEPEQLNSVFCEQACFIKIEAVAKKIDGKWVREDENGAMSYRLSAEVSPDDGSLEREPNNTGAIASPLGVGKSIRGTIFPKKDVDYFQVDLRDRQVKTPLRGTLLGMLKVDVGLYLHRVEADGTLTLVQSSDGAKGDKAERVRFSAEPGLYVFEVRDAKNREANFQDSYQLSVEEGDE